MFFKLILTISVTNGLPQAQNFYQNYQLMPAQNIPPNLYGYYENDQINSYRYDPNESYSESKDSRESRRPTEDYDDEKDWEHTKVKIRCLCSCQICGHRPRRCCKEFCENCKHPNEAIVLVPYAIPYPIGVPNVQYDVSDTTSRTTTVDCTTTGPSTQSYQSYVEDGSDAQINKCPGQSCYLVNQKQSHNIARNDESVPMDNKPVDPIYSDLIKKFDWKPSYGLIHRTNDRNLESAIDDRKIYVQPNRKIDKSIYSPGRRRVYLDGSVDKTSNEVVGSEPSEMDSPSRYLDNLRDTKDTIVLRLNHTWYIPGL